MDITQDTSLDLGLLEPPLSPLSPADLLLNHHATDTPRSEFCNPSNFASCLNYVNLLLTAQGYPVPLVLHGTNEQDACRIVNCLYALLQDKRQLSDDCNELHETLDAVRRDQEHLQSRLSHCQKELEESRRENVQLRAKLDSTEQKLKSEKEQNRNLREELQKAKNNMQYMKAQYAHETRRHEQEYAKTRERLYKLMDERQKTNVSSLTINESPPVDTRMNNNNSNHDASGQNVLYTDLLDKSSNREKEARMESDTLRSLFVDIYTTIAMLLQRQIRNYEEEEEGFENVTIESREAAQFQLPINIGATSAVERIHDLLARLREEWDRQIAKRRVYTEQDMMEKDNIIARLEETNDELIEAIEQCHEEFEGKAKILMKFAEGGFFENINPHADPQLSDSESSVLDEEPGLESQLKKLRQTIREERRQVTQAAIQLGDERRKLSAERWAFQEMKRALKMQEIIEDLPSPEESADNISHNTMPSPRRRRRSDAITTQSNTYDRIFKRLKDSNKEVGS